jgi:thiamine biosynthesis protein ThiI
MNRVVIHYHEIALKGGNRKVFVRQLVDNLRRGLRGTGVHRVRSTPGRIVIALQKRADWPEMRARIGRTYGIANFALALRTEPEMEAMTEGILSVAASVRFDSFAVRTRRSDKSFPMTSMQISSVLGAAVKQASGASVNLKQPEVVLTVELLGDAALISAEKIAGPGGLPVGTAGSVLALLSGGIDSPVAAARMMRRGCRVELVHFHAVPFQDRRGIDKAKELAETLTRYQYASRLHLVPFGEIQRDIVTQVGRPFRVVLYRRMMFRIAEALARRREAEALVTGESLGQVASQTLRNIATIGDAVSIPLLRPLIGMDKQEITAEAERLGTYEISSQPDQDCCQLFVPAHPATGVSIGKASALESGLDLEALIERALGRMEVVEYEYPGAPGARDEREVVVGAGD